MADRVLNIPDEPKEANYIIAYIDLLGTKEKISQGKGTKVFENIYNAFLLAGNIMPQMKDLNYSQMKVKVFSDNIILAYPVAESLESGDVLSSYKIMISYLKFFLYILLKHNVLFRGAISINKLMINDLIVWGEGLSEVVYLEENVAIYPRIVLSDRLTRFFKDFSFDEHLYCGELMCAIDFDDCYYYDFIDYEDFEAADFLLEISFKNIIEKINKETNPKVLQKYKWFKNYLDMAQIIFDEYTQHRKDL